MAFSLPFFDSRTEYNALSLLFCADSAPITASKKEYESVLRNIETDGMPLGLFIVSFWIPRIVFIIIALFGIILEILPGSGAVSCQYTSQDHVRKDHVLWNVENVPERSDINL